MSGTEAIVVHTELRARHSLCGDLGMLVFFFCHSHDKNQ